MKKYKILVCLVVFALGLQNSAEAKMSRGCKQILFVIAPLAVGSYYLMKTFVVGAENVGGVSMVPTFQDGQTVIANRLAYLHSAPQRGDIVVLKDPDHYRVVKRIVGLPGEKVEFRDGKVYINGVELVEPYLAPGVKTFPARDDRAVFFLRNDEFLPLGDNRPNSIDGRAYGPVPEGFILGKVWVTP